MRQLFRILTSTAWLLLCAATASQSAEPPIDERYPPADEAWNSTHYAALAQRIESEGLAPPTLSGSAKSIFERMVNADNIPLRMGLNKDLSVTLRYQKLEPVLQPLHKLVGLYSSEMQKGKPYAAELARLRVYESKAAAALLELSEPYAASLQKDKSYKYQMANLNQIKTDAHQIYDGLVQSVTETSLYSKSDMLKMISGAMADLPSYQPIFTNEDRQALMQRLAQQISKTSDGELKSALTELRDAIEHRRLRT